MKKQKYYYNPKTLSYEYHEIGWKKKLWLITGWISSSIMAGLILLIVYASFFQSPKERKMQSELIKMKLEYKLTRQELNEMNQVLADLQNRDDNIYRMIFEAEPISKNVREGGFGGSKMYERFAGFDNGKLMADIDSSVEHMKRKLYIQSLSYDELEEMIKNKEKMLASIPAIQPISNEDLTRLSSGFGWRIHPIYKTMRMHEGLDFTAPRNSEIYATGDGVVDIAKRSRGYGNEIWINHGFGYRSHYCHMQKYIVHVGEKVKRGQLIGYVGSTGLSTAPHLHYEIAKNGVKINPINFFYNDLSPEQYDQLIEIAEQANQSFD